MKQHRCKRCKFTDQWKQAFKYPCSFHVDLLQRPIKTANQVTNQGSHGEKGNHDSLNPVHFSRWERKEELQTQSSLKQSPVLEPAEAVWFMALRILASGKVWDHVHKQQWPAGQGSALAATAARFTDGNDECWEEVHGLNALNLHCTDFYFCTSNYLANPSLARFPSVVFQWKELALILTKQHLGRRTVGVFKVSSQPLAPVLALAIRQSNPGLFQPVTTN